MKTKISLPEARSWILQAQGLIPGSQDFGRGPVGALKTVEHLGYVQIDTISVVERAHHHVFWSRTGDYRPEMLDDLLSRERSVYEYWNHAVSYLPMRDYRYSIPLMQAIAAGKYQWYSPRPTRMIKPVLDRIRVEGPLRAQDFEAPPGHKSGVWFNAKPAKRALEQLLYEGQLMVSGRRGFQKLYDLTERVLPRGVDTSVPSPDELARFVIRRALRAHGFAQASEIHYLLKFHRANVLRTLPEMLEDGELIELAIAGTEASRYYALAEAASTVLGKPVPLRDDLRPVLILSPFDNLVIQRNRLKNLFGFDYQIECYVPAPKRKHGYFCLPLLWGDRFVGRVDAKAERKQGVLKIQSLHFEPWVKESRASLRSQLKRALDSALTDFAGFNGCAKVQRFGL